MGVVEEVEEEVKENREGMGQGWCGGNDEVGAELLETRTSYCPRGPYPVPAAPTKLGRIRSVS